MGDLDLRAFRTPALHLALLALVVSVSACTVGPDYQPPEAVAPEATAAEASFHHASPPEAPPEAEEAPSLYDLAEPEAAWWTGLGDPVLDDLMERARRANPDLRAAEANVRAARALLGLERWERLPSATARAGAELQEQSVAGLAIPVDGFEGFDRTDTFYSAGLDASWEIDLFGRVRRSIEAQAARLEVSEAERRGVFVSVAGEIGRTYMELRGTQGRLAVARANVTNQEESLELVRALLEAGRGTDLERAQAESQLRSTEASIPLLEAAEAAAIHRLAVLVGEPPAALLGLLSPTADLPPVPERITVGSPAELLRRRPDIDAAERRLAAATAEIGVATADLFPRVSLGGSVGLLSTSLSDLPSGDARTLSFGPFLQWAAFDLGRVRDRIRVAEAGTDGALARYEGTVLRALEETENALVALARARERQAALVRAQGAAEDAAELARLRYRAGLDSFLVVLDAERRLLIAQDALADSATRTGLAFVDLYTALGGGWETLGPGKGSGASAAADPEAEEEPAEATTP